MKALLLVSLVCLCACSWFGRHRSPQAAAPTQIIVTGAPAGAEIYVDGQPKGEAITHNDESQILDVAPGAHKVEIHRNGAVVYREDTYVGAGVHRVISVLSGMTR